MERNNKLKPRMGFSYKEPFSGGRGSSKDEEYEVLDATFSQDNNGSYDLKMSPRFEERKSKNHSQSSKDDYSRSVRLFSLNICTNPISFEIKLKLNSISLTEFL